MILRFFGTSSLTMTEGISLLKMTGRETTLEDIKENTP
jgi:hypothetical protein